MSNTGFAFGDLHPSPDNFNTFNPKDVYADAGVAVPPPIVEKIPPPTSTPLVMTLEEVLGTAATNQIQKSGQLVFHSAGDTGGVKVPSHQFAVADAMAADLAGKDLTSGQPAFLYHLGDVVYFFGQEQYYFDQFYDPYRDYDAPIFAIPGNHDSVTSPSVPMKFSLQPFVENFCTKKPVKDSAAQGCARTTMTQPGVYFTLDAPLAKIIGLYSNAGETAGVISGGAAGTAQLAFLLAQLQAAVAQRKKGDVRALILAVHHPPFTGSAGHFPSPDMLAQIDAQCVKAGIWPDLVLSGHAHLYERYTRTMKSDGRQIPYVVSGNGGYQGLEGFRTGQGGATAKVGIPGNDGKGNVLTLEAFNEYVFGYLRVTVTPNSIAVNSMGVNEQTKTATSLDYFTVDLTKHVLSTGAAAATSSAAQSPKMTAASPKKNAPAKGKRK